jgi:PAS domain S-box-containing protein
MLPKSYLKTESAAPGKAEIAMNFALKLQDSGTKRMIARDASAALVLILLAAVLAHAQQQGSPKRVLVLYWDNKDFPGNVLFDQNFQAVLQSGQAGKVEYYPEYLESNRFPGEAQSGFLYDYLRQKYADRKIDVVVASPDAPLNFLLKHRTDLFPQAPIVFVAVKPPPAEQLLTEPGMTGIVHVSTHRETLELALRLHPDTEQVFVVSGTPERDNRFETIARKELQSYEARVRINYLTDFPLNELIAKTKTLPNRSIILYVWQQAFTEQGQMLETWEVLASFAPTASAPIYGMGSGNVGHGLVGGYVSSPEANGTRIGEIVVRILKGERPQDIRVKDAPAIYMFDWRELKRRGISEDRLPAGSQVRFKTVSFWELYKWYIVGIIAAFIIESLLIVWLLLMHARQRQAERESKRQARLAEAERRHLDEVVSNVPGVVWETRIDAATNTRQATFVSDYAEKMLGYSAEEWLSAPGFALKLVHEEERERVERESEAILANQGEGVLQFRWVAKDGRALWVETHLAPILDESGNVMGLRGVTIDITEQKQAEVARRQSEERNRAILQAIPDLMFLQTRDGIYLDYNAKDIEELYVLPEEFLGKNMRDVLPPELAEKLLNSFQLAYETGEPQVVEYALTIEGRERWYEARIVRTGENILSVIREITERKQAETALHSAMVLSERQRAQLESIFHTVADGIIVSDMAGNVLLVNEAMARIHGHESPDEMKQNLTYFAARYELFHPDGRPITYDEWPLSKALRGESVADWEVLVRRLDNGLEWFLSYSGEPVRDELGEQVLALLVTHDITERKASEEALRQSEARFREMADTAPVMIWIAGTDNLCTYVNKQWLDFAGRSIDEELGNGWTDRIHPDDRSLCRETYDSASGRKEPFTLEYRLRRADGAFRWVLDTGTPRFSSAEEFLGYIGSCVDITDRKESEEALQTALEEVNQLKNQLHEENIYLREEIKLEHNFSEIVGHGDAIKYVLHKIEQVAPTDSTVLIMGETGTGKELVARAIHSESLRRDYPLVKINCAALSASLIENELFGHEKGAFTGAASRKIGRFELADRATLFLDEIGELPQELQVKLLRVIQEGEFERLGSTRTLKVNVRIIAATNRNLLEEVHKGFFREDLWYRLNVFPITMPPLRQRVEDIPLLVEHFVNNFSKKMGRKITSVAPATMNALRNYSWPGNIRELANVIERAVIKNGGEVLHISNISEALPAKAQPTASKTLEETEREYIIAVLEKTGGKIEGPHGAAQILGLHPSTLRSRIAKLRIQKTQHNFV